MSFDGDDAFEKMLDYMQKQTEWANAHLADPQKAITYGDHWARFDQEWGLIFGRVATLEEATASTPASEKDYEVASIAEQHERGYMFGKAYSVIEPDGEWGDTHRVHMWPITGAMFHAVERVSWDQKNLGLEMKIALMSVHQAWYDHARSIVS